MNRLSSASHAARATTEVDRWAPGATSEGEEVGREETGAGSGEKAGRDQEGNEFLHDVGSRFLPQGGESVLDCGSWGESADSKRCLIHLLRGDEFDLMFHMVADQPP